MSNTWRYTDVYEVIIRYITNHLDPTNYGLNFGIIALHEISPRVIIRFTLKNTRNNRKKELDTTISRWNIGRSLWQYLWDSRSQ